MGHQDLERIHPVYRDCIEFCRLAGINLKFKEDLGSYETALEFIEDMVHHPPISKSWKNMVLCPDVLVLSGSKPIGVIEFEEETGNRRNGAYLAKKGHGHEGDYDTKRDTKRNEYYDMANIKLLRIWESDNNYKPKLFRFILDLTQEAFGSS